MTILLKNKHTLKVDDFYFNCSIGKNGVSDKKIEGDKKHQLVNLKLNTCITEKTE